MSTSLPIDNPPIKGRRKIVCLCGSTNKALAMFRKKNTELTLAGIIVLSIGVEWHTDESLFSGMDEEAKLKIKRGLDELHRDKIAMSDEILVLNVGGYIGESTAGEIEYARSLRKKISYLEPLSASEEDTQPQDVPLPLPDSLFTQPPPEEKRGESNAATN